MRILIAHEALAGGGGVESYLAALIPALVRQGHAVALLHHNPRSESGPTRLEFADVPAFGVADVGFDGAMARATAWRPDVCFSHNMRHLDVDEALASRWAVVKMMHGYFGTCVSAQKTHGFPGVVPCERAFGAACLGLYFPRRCGQLHPLKMLRSFAWTSRQHALLGRYAAIVVASRHMRQEYVRQGVPGERIIAAPLFPTIAAPALARTPPAEPTVLFVGRMTALKGPRILVEATALVSKALGRAVKLVMAGDGPERQALTRVAQGHGLNAIFPGWVTGDALNALFRSATLLAVPSEWPEPFGLVGLEAAAHGVPAVAFDVGGIDEWLRDGVNGRLVRRRGDARAFGRALADVLGSERLQRSLACGALRVASEMSRERHVTILEETLAVAARRPAAV